VTKGKKPSNAVATIRPRAIRILVVDDHRDSAESLRMLLAEQGYEVRTAASIKQALEVAESYEFGMLISDIGLPDGHGTELLARLRSATARPILGIATSGFGMEDDRQRSRQAGFAEHLTKPVEFAVLNQAVTRLAAL
jgi:two-component system CheB/CheR fusion protein